MSIDKLVKTISAAILASALLGCPGTLSQNEIREFDREIQQEQLRKSYRTGSYYPAPTYAERR